MNIKKYKQFVFIALAFCSVIFQPAALPIPSPIDAPKPHAVKWWLSSGFENGDETHSFLGFLYAPMHFGTVTATYWQSLVNRRPYFDNNNQIDDWVASGKPPAVSSEPRITWLGHSTFLIQIAGVNIITDPVFGDLSVLFPRKTPCGVAFDDLPRIDIVIISHNHRDHMDKNSLKRLQKRDNPLCLVPLKCGPLMHKWGVTDIKELDWWGFFYDANRYTDDMFLFFLPAWHWSGRALYDENTTLWGSWMIQAHGKTIYFAGDSAYHQEFYKAIAQAFPPIDVALMPIGPNEPHESVKDEHMSAEEAGQAFIDLKAKAFIPMHWGTFWLGTDSFIDPITRLNKWWAVHAADATLAGKKLKLVKLGEQIDV
jgi:L-ascorbate metabolism protein UlaG (beta-lactamase superfamily)